MVYLPENVNKECGIYRIVNLRNGKFYVGSTKNIKARKRDHFRMLRNNNHHCAHLQSAWNKEEDKSVFDFQVFIYCKFNDLQSIEQSCFTFMKPHYNTNSRTDRPPLFNKENHPRFGTTGEKSPIWGKTGENAPNPTLTEEQAVFILNSPKSHLEIAKQFNINTESVRRLRIGRTWRHLPPASFKLVEIWKIEGGKAKNAALHKMNSKTKKQRLEAGRKGSKTKADKNLSLQAEANIPSDWPSEAIQPPEAKALLKD